MGNLIYPSAWKCSSQDPVKSRASVSASKQGGSSLQEQAKIDEPTARQAALGGAGGGTLTEIELETSDNGYVVYDVEVAGNDGNDHEVKGDAGNAKILHQDLEDEVDESGAGETDDSD